MTGKIALEGLEFHAFHGVYPEELESGNWFEVDISVETSILEGTVEDNLANTVNYETLYRFVKEEMDRPSRLLETVAEKVVVRVLAELQAVEQVEVKISKVNPPIGGKCRKATVRLSKNRS